MQENQTATYFLRSRLFTGTYDIMKNFNCNISLWFFKSKFMSYNGKHFFFIKIKKNNIKSFRFCTVIKKFQLKNLMELAKRKWMLSTKHRI